MPKDLNKTKAGVRRRLSRRTLIAAVGVGVVAAGAVHAGEIAVRKWHGE
jgi:hypothetical protein